MAFSVKVGGNRRCSEPGLCVAPPEACVLEVCPALPSLPAFLQHHWAPQFSSRIPSLGDQPGCVEICVRY